MTDFKPILEAKGDAELLQMVYDFETWGPAMHQAVETELSKRNILPTDVQKRKQEMNAGKYSTEADSYNYRRIEAQFGTGHPQAQLSYGCFNGPASNLVFSRTR